MYVSSGEECFSVPLVSLLVAKAKFSSAYLQNLFYTSTDPSEHQE
jgi:hypothetical protein